MGFEWLPLKNYKRHYICLNCQKGFKRASEEDMKEPQSIDLSNLMEDYYKGNTRQDIVNYIQAAYQKLEVICPNCQGLMLQVHYDFEVPPRRDRKSWKKIKERLSSKTILQYDAYIYWHRRAIQEAVGDAVQLKILAQNLASLEKAAKVFR